MRTGPFHVRIHTSLPAVAGAIAPYDYPLGADDEYVDFDIRLNPAADCAAGYVRRSASSMKASNRSCHYQRTMRRRCSNGE